MQVAPELNRKICLNEMPKQSCCEAVLNKMREAEMLAHPLVEY